MNIFKIIWNIKNIRSILEGSYKLLNHLNSPDDFNKLIIVVQKIQSWLKNVLIILGSDINKLDDEVIVVASIIKETDQIGIG